VATTGRTWQRPGLSLRVLWPGSAEDAHRTSAAEHGAGEGDAANDCSIVIEALWEDGTRLVSLGDLEPAAQQELAALDPGPADIVKVAHHGSRFQHAPLYRQLEPDLALVPAGRDNEFGHPTEDALTLLRETRAGVLRSDVHGTVVLPADGAAAPRSVGPARSAQPVPPAVRSPRERCRVAQRRPRTDRAGPRHREPDRRSGRAAPARPRPRGGPDGRGPRPLRRRRRPRRPRPGGQPLPVRRTPLRGGARAAGGPRLPRARAAGLRQGAG